MPQHGPDVAIVTGAARGIGAATAQHLATGGLHVVAVDLDGDALGHRWDASTLPVDVLVGDVADPSCAAAAVARARSLGELRALINNAGIVRDRAFAAQPDAEWAAVMSSVLAGTRTMTRAVVAAMCDRAREELSVGPDAVATPRRIVTTVPATAVTGSAGGSASAAAGAAVAALTATLAREVGGFGIRVNAVLVGYVTTRLTGPRPPEPPEDLAGEAGIGGHDGVGLPEPVRQMAAATTALGRFGTPEEVAAVHAFLVSAAADYVTGALVPVTGGLLGT